MNPQHLRWLEVTNAMQIALPHGSRPSLLPPITTLPVPRLHPCVCYAGDRFTLLPESQYAPAAEQRS